MTIEKCVEYDFLDVIPQLRTLIEEAGVLYCPLDDEFLIKFIRARKGNVERSFKMVNEYFKIRKEYPKTFNDLYPSAHIGNLEKRIQGILKEKDIFNRKVLTCDIGRINPSEMTCDDLFKCQYLYMEEIVKDEEVQVDGITVVLNLDQFSYRHLAIFGISDAKKLIKLIQDAFPLKMKQIHIINQPYVFNIAYALVKPFLKTKLKNRFYFHGFNLEEFHKSLLPTILPISMGGIKNDAFDDQIFQNILKNDDKYKDFLKYGMIK